MKELTDIIIRPHLSEKATALHEKGVYTFIVNDKANKVEIKKAVEAMYGVTVKSVRTLRYQGKVKTRYTKSQVLTGRTPAFKKALVQVAEGDFIDIYEV
ncbi:large subunit ribosomal protein L23 [Thermonema lapsum]|jgi:large subunit ribosomal protein L23|uniref:Large ribosomal subunit protein uL23 n=1 Tax=Thermonema lapsum TaxID=28195 RepID=A0A846MSJ0_9BACT|nr:50S ribosomal protein L23 [Thermonema lapsum]NIK74566.1 large subunit ribosomal protein L23 [Thermonema lapsum]